MVNDECRGYARDCTCPGCTAMDKRVMGLFMEALRREKDGK